MITKDNIIKIFCSVDDFCQEFAPYWEKHLIDSGKKRIRKPKMSLSETMTIQILFHLSQYRTFKAFYVGYVKQHLRGEFPILVSYNRMTEIQKRNIIPLTIYLKTCCLSKCTGVTFVDSTPLRVCHNKIIKQHKTFKHLALRGHCSLGWFYGFKIHILVNDKGGIVNFMITKGNTDDRKPLKFEHFIKKLFGKLFGDKGYISKDLFKMLLNKHGIHIVTKLKKNMKTKLLTPIEDAFYLRKKAVVESIFDQLKNICQIEHSRHRSTINYFNNILTAIIAYSFKEKKPSVRKNYADTMQMKLMQL